MKAPFLYLGARMGSFMYFEGVKVGRPTWTAHDRPAQRGPATEGAKVEFLG